MYPPAFDNTQIFFKGFERTKTVRWAEGEITKMTLSAIQHTELNSKQKR